MRAIRFPWLGLLAPFALAGLPASADARAPGSEFKINTYTTSHQRTIGGGGDLVAADESGNFVVVWYSAGQDGSGYGIFGQRFDSAGGTLGGEFRVNSYTSGVQSYPTVASDPSGNFVVAWKSLDQDGSDLGVFGQRYDSAGGTLGSEFRVNSYTTSRQSRPSVATDASGNFVVVWESNGQDGSNGGIFGQRYDSAGGTLGGEFRVNSYTTAKQGYPTVASDADGNFVVVWESLGQDGSNDGIFGQRYDGAGATLGTEFRVNSFTTNGQRSPDIASDSSGNFVVVWESVGQDGGSYGIFGQRYDGAGVAQGDEFQANSFTTGAQRSPSVASDASGNFLVAWHGDLQDGGAFGIFGQRYDSTGVAQGQEFQINSFTTGVQAFPSVASTSTDQFVVAWDSNGQDGSGYGVFGRRVNFAQSITVTSPNRNVTWRIGSLHKIQWRHNLGVGETFRIELDRDNNGTYEELLAAAAPAGATKGSFAWTVTGPPSATARVRVSWTDDLSVSDASDVTFQIRP